MRFTSAIVVGMMALAGAAGAQPIDQVRVGDLPGTNQDWQEGQVVVAAPAAEVQRWFTDASQWAARFPDDSDVRDYGRMADGRHVVRFHSNALGRTLTVAMTEQPGLITYEGKGKDVKTHGKIYIQPLGPSLTRITMQTTGELHGIAGVFGTENMKRSRALKKLSSDLYAAVRLSKAYAATPRTGF
jgi:carbon monoxide dehydrogenase subunit G